MSASRLLTRCPGVYVYAAQPPGGYARARGQEPSLLVILVARIVRVVTTPASSSSVILHPGRRRRSDPTRVTGSHP
ncbi:hypothetical protein HMPREF1129_1600 [Actinomyces naeslundii str. Howell 279]|uniref:Uncharacterized protein n=1 Tax=Actinomyces naeslundii (strain ATCC 12104 / DSM 43013 / CCUG 2238 / JCM 8349 / NCTC 10301 / Howell 279) TaxID=1115803 RepID=J3AA92_ACTNH|nr:hypothetical protein HMPREF1129_1600 [Actinomyces naeslundii str. Howell 279]